MCDMYVQTTERTSYPKLTSGAGLDNGALGWCHELFGQ